MITPDDFPAHKCGLFLSHNEHRDYYQSLPAWLEEQFPDGDEAEFWVSPEERAKAIATDECWELHWYPETPIGSHRLLASSLEVLLQAATQKKE